MIEGSVGRVTLDDVAAAAGVSKATASKVLNRRGGASVETRRRVEQAMQELGYVPITRERGPMETGAVNVVFDTFLSLYSLRVLEGLVDGAQEFGVDLVTNVLDPALGSPLVADPTWVRSVADKGHAGIVLVTTNPDRSLVRACRLEDVPLLAIDSPALADDVVSISSDHWGGGLQAVGHLIALGHRRIAFVGGQHGNAGFRERLGAYREALADAGIEYDPTIVAEDGVGRTEEILPGFLALHDAPTAVFATNDADAMAAVRVAVRAGLRVPEDISVVGYDDTYATLPTAPDLTTVRTPMHEIGRLAVQTVIEMRRGGQPLSRRVQLSTELVERESTAALQTGRHGQADSRRT